MKKFKVEVQLGNTKIYEVKADSYKQAKEKIRNASFEFLENKKNYKLGDCYFEVLEYRNAEEYQKFIGRIK